MNIQMSGNSGSQQTVTGSTTANKVSTDPTETAVKPVTQEPKTTPGEIVSLSAAGRKAAAEDDGSAGTLGNGGGLRPPN